MEPLFRHAAAAVLAVFGVILMLAAADPRAGLAVLVLAVAIEVLGVLIDRRR